MKRLIIMETWPGMKRIINTRKCEPVTGAVAVIPAVCRFASVVAACTWSCVWFLLPRLTGLPVLGDAAGLARMGPLKGQKVGGGWKSSQAPRESYMAENLGPVLHTAHAGHGSSSS